MTYLLQKNVAMSNAAQEKLVADFRTSPDPTQITVLLYVIKSYRKSRHGEVSAKRHDLFGWGAHWKSDVPEEAVWEIEGRKFVIQDGRWETPDELVLDVVDGQFRMLSCTTGNGS